MNQSPESSLGSTSTASLGAVMDSTQELIGRFVNPPEKRWQRMWAWLSERANPIVIKEARQSLHSRQFTISFSLTLAAVAIWTVMAIITQLPDLYYMPGGAFLLSGYLAILAFPLLLVIPFSAFRSMVIESEERTFELVSISALTAIQIVQGKMLSACLQIGVYLSALAPCIVITYLLRGVSLPAIVNYLIGSVLLSVLLTGVSILIATIGRSRLIQVFASICVLAGLLIIFFYWTIATSLSLTTFGGVGVGPVDQLSWLVALSLSTIVGALIMVCLRCAAAAIDFASENHAFTLRSRLLLAATIILFWGLWWAIKWEADEVCMVFLMGILGGSLVVGGLVAGERGIISPRAQRTLPRTIIGRVFLTWFYPGAGLGYVFLTCLVTSMVSVWIAIGVFGSSLQLGIRFGDSIAALGIVVLSYFVFYSGLTRLVMLMVSRNAVARVVVAFLIQLVLIVGGTLGSYSLALVVNNFQGFDYGLHQVLNVTWTVQEFASRGVTVYNQWTLWVLPLLAFVIFVLNLVLCGRDVLLVRVGMPERLQEELASDASKTQSVPDPFE